jgi:hypothetical protein
MTPKEKAKELYNKYWILTPQPFIERVEYYNESKLIFNNWDKDWTNKYAKQCALIAVDEILNIGCIEVPYWDEVKQEIERL